MTFLFYVGSEPYVPPEGDSVDFLFEVNCSPPDGDSVDFDFDA